MSGTMSFMAMCVLASLTSSEGIEPSNAAKRLDCGPCCVRYLSRYFLGDMSLQAAYDLCCFSPDSGKMTNLLQIKRALEKLGLHCLGFAGSLRDVSRPYFSDCAFVIAEPKEKHFAIVARAKNENEWLFIDPISERTKLLTVDFREHHPGEYVFLAVSRAPVTVTQTGGSSGWHLRGADCVRLALGVAVAGAAAALLWRRISRCVTK